jgi:predicted O-linked N-acetylglucosamine transferase (SPINDLY family)
MELPDDGNALLEIGRAARKQRDIRLALRSFTRATEVTPDSADAWAELAYTLWQVQRYNAALDAVERALRLDPKSGLALVAQGNALLNLGQCAESVAAFRAALAIDPDHRVARSNLLLALAYVPEIGPAEVLAEHVEWAKRHAPAAPARQYANHRDRDRRIRIGYVSADFRNHPVMTFIEPLLAKHDRSQVEVFCYSDPPITDATTQRAATLADHFRDIRGRSDEEVDRLMTDDRIDILIDLAGHTAGNRLTLFARKPAPVQATYLGYPNTTAIPSIRYRITDAVADPPGMTDSHFTEQLIRLNRCAWCYSPPPNSPPVSPPPSASTGVITFGCFTRVAKISPLNLDLWAELLKVVPNSRLLIKSINITDEIAVRLRKHLQARAVQADRIIIAGPDKEAALHFSRYGQIDIALDTFPYAGTTMTCEALCMGVPLITLAGNTHVSRVGATLLGAVDLNELVTSSCREYVDAAAAFANDPTRLRSLRAGLRERFMTSPLLDGRGLAMEIERVMRQIWRDYCNSAERSS